MYFDGTLLSHLAKISTFIPFLQCQDLRILYLNMLDVTIELVDVIPFHRLDDKECILWES